MCLFSANRIPNEFPDKDSLKISIIIFCLYVAIVPATNNIGIGVGARVYMQKKTTKSHLKHLLTHTKTPSMSEILTSL